MAAVSSELPLLTTTQMPDDVCDDEVYELARAQTLLLVGLPLLRDGEVCMLSAADAGARELQFGDGGGGGGGGGDGHGRGKAGGGNQDDEEHRRSRAALQDSIAGRAPGHGRGRGYGATGDADGSTSLPTGQARQAGHPTSRITPEAVAPLTDHFARLAHPHARQLYRLWGCLGMYARPRSLCNLCPSPCGRRRGRNRFGRAVNSLWLAMVSISIVFAIFDLVKEAVSQPSALYTVTAYLPAVAAFGGMLYATRTGYVHFLLATLALRSQRQASRAKRQMRLVMVTLLVLYVVTTTWIIYYDAVIARRGSLESLSEVVAVSVTFPVRSLVECALTVTVVSAMVATREDLAEYYAQLSARKCEPRVAALRFEATLDRMELATQGVGKPVSWYIMGLVVYFIAFLVKVVEHKTWVAADWNDVWYLITVLSNASFMLLSVASVNGRLLALAKELAFPPAWMPKSLLGSATSEGAPRSWSRRSSSLLSPPHTLPMPHQRPRMHSVSESAQSADADAAHTPATAEQHALSSQHLRLRRGSGTSATNRTVSNAGSVSSNGDGATATRLRVTGVLGGNSESNRLALFIQMLQGGGTLGVRVGGLVVLFSRLALLLYACSTVCVYCVHYALRQAVVHDQHIQHIHAS